MKFAVTPLVLTAFVPFPWLCASPGPRRVRPERPADVALVSFTSGPQWSLRMFLLSGGSIGIPTPRSVSLSLQVLGGPHSVKPDMQNLNFSQLWVALFMMCSGLIAMSLRILNLSVEITKSYDRQESLQKGSRIFTSTVEVNND